MARRPDPEAAGSPERRGRVLDQVGLGVAAAALAWALVASLGRPDARPAPVVWLVVWAVVLVVAGRRVSPDEPATVPGALAVAVAGAVVLGYPAILRAGGGPTGYANSNASLVGLGAVAAAAAAATTPRRTRRRAWVGLAAGLGLTVGATGSLAGSVALGAVGVLAAATVLRAHLAPAVIGGLVAASITLGVTVAIAAGGDPLGLGERAGLRSDLWARALDQVRAEPVRGSGPGSYAAGLPPTVDDDLRWAHHGYLQQAAEQGVVGLGLLLSLVAWAYARLWSGRRRPTARTIAGAAAVTLVALHATVDHVLHAPAVPLTLAVLVGWATVDRPSRGTRGSPRPHR